MSTLETERPLRIGEVAELVGTTTRTIRYYEEIGLLPGSADREQGKHRCYTQADVERVHEIVRLRDLLGLSLEQLSKLLEAETARAELRKEWKVAESGVQRRRIIDEALEHVGTQLELVRGRRAQLEQLEGELEAKRQSLHERVAELEA
ncbi:MAG TPA: MerR family transcriptional regulator [Solirubrobacteraceae bacterium]|nr:MerR family transcriptional regulator [Solirubrobacteraceae bacterium]